jgi:hypothetical protein
MKWEEIKEKYNKNDKIKSLKDGVVRTYSGYLTLAGVGYDSFDEDLVLFKDGELAEVIEKGIDHEAIERNRHIDNVRRTCKRLNCTPTELLQRDYINELNINN